MGGLWVSVWVAFGLCFPQWCQQPVVILPALVIAWPRCVSSLGILCRADGAPANRRDLRPQRPRDSAPLSDRLRCGARGGRVTTDIPQGRRRYDRAKIAKSPSFGSAPYISPAQSRAALRSMSWAGKGAPSAHGQAGARAVGLGVGRAADGARRGDMRGGSAARDDRHPPAYSIGGCRSGEIGAEPRGLESVCYCVGKRWLLGWKAWSIFGLIVGRLFCVVDLPFVIFRW